MARKSKLGLRQQRQRYSKGPQIDLHVLVDLSACTYRTCTCIAIHVSRRIWVGWTSRMDQKIAHYQEKTKGRKRKAKNGYVLYL